MSNSEANPGRARRLLIVDDEVAVARSLARTLASASREVVTAASAEAALAELEKGPFQVVISDYRMPGMDGVDLLRRVKTRWPLTQRIMLTGYADPDAIQEAVNAGEVFRFVTKPWDDGSLRLTLASAFEHYDAVAENERLHEIAAQQNEQLRELTRDLEARVEERTQNLRQAKRDWEVTFDAIQSPVAIVRSDCTVQRANVAYAKAAGVEVKKVRDRRCHEILFGRPAPCDGCPMKQSLDGATQPPVEIAGRAGRTYRMQAFGSCSDSNSTAVCVYQDVTEEKEIQRLMVLSEKMAAVGRLAGAVAHEINNPLGAILAFSQIMKRDEGRPADDVEALAHIEENALRCKRIVGSLLAFARRSPGKRMPMDVGAAIEETCVLFRAQLKGHPRAQLSVAPEPGLLVLGDRGHIEQALLNLLQNALAALPPEGGDIAVRAFGAGGRVNLEVRDTGCGIPDENLSGIFEPSFTTKAQGEGAGLGLAVVYGVVEAHGGTLSVKSKVGAGTTVIISLPRHAEPDSEE